MPESISPEANYSTRSNIKWPGSQAAATAAETAAAARLTAILPSLTFTTSGTIKVAS